MAGPSFDRKRRRSAEEERVRRMLDEGDLEGLADLMNEHFAARVVDVQPEGIGLIQGAVESDVILFRRRVREDPAAALNLVRGPPLQNMDTPWAVAVREQLQAEIVAAAHAACRLDPANTAEHLRKGLLGAPGDATLWIGLFGVAGRSGSVQALEMAYGWARDTYATAGPGTVPADVEREYAHWRRELASS
jgi:hypothetical protein